MNWKLDFSPVTSAVGIVSRAVLSFVGFSMQRDCAEAIEGVVTYT